jgi:hypothetical protein
LLMKRCFIALLFLSLLMSQHALQSFAAAITLPQTGQTSCWDASGASISCVGTGQDGALQNGLVWPKPRFIDNGDQTISDNLTGLVWSKDGNPAGAAKTWQQALDYIKTLNSQNFLGHNDWRLPNINELRSLANAQQGDLTAWLNTQGISNVQPDSYWSSDSDDFNTSRAWYIGLDSGYVYSNYKTYTLYVWPVRTGQSASLIIASTGQTGCWDASGVSVSCNGTGQDGESQTGAAWPTTRFSSNADQTVTDNLTGLIWTKDADLMITRDPTFDNDYVATNNWESSNDGAVSWQHALDYIKKLNNESYLGYSDWRLPNRDELVSLINWQAGYPAVWLNLLAFTNVAADYYWSSSNDPFYPTTAWFVDMGSGYIDSYYKTDNHYVWPVRGMAAQTISFTPAATATYGDPAITLSATATSGLPANFTLVSGPATLTGNLLTITGAGTITVKASQAGNSNYSAAADVTKSITVSPKALTITANNASRAYGGANPANPGFTAPVLTNGDSISSVTYSYAATATATAAVGTTHSITPSAAVFTSGTSANYSIIYVAGTLTIAGTASQTIAFTPAATATYGDSAVTLSATATSSLPASFTLVSGPATLTNNLLTIAGVGTITVKASQAGNSNYAAAPDVTKSITVSPKALTITANNASRAYGAANPANPGFTAPALASGDSISSVTYSYAATATTTAAVGTTYSITPSAAVFSSGTTANYTISYVAGTLSITAATQTSPPNITLSTLADGSVTNNTTLNVAGSATDAIGIKQVTVNGTVVTVNVTGAFSQAVNLVTGINQITVTATNYSDLTATVIRNITLDQTAPLITLTEPADNSFTNKTFVTLSGTVSENAIVTISVQETSSSQLASMNGNAFSATANLVSGVNTITIAATDVAGNSSKAKRTITSDTAAPILAITDPAQDIRVTDTTYLLKGTVSDTVSQATVAVYIDGQKFTPSVVNGAFSQQLFFTSEKQYSVTVTATDQAGNSATVQRNIIYSRVSTGDLNGDGKVDVADALRALQIAIGLIMPTAADVANGDVGPLVNGKPAPDGKINLSDAVVILEKAVGLVSW